MEAVFLQRNTKSTRIETKGDCYYPYYYNTKILLILLLAIFLPYYYYYLYREKGETWSKKSFKLQPNFIPQLNSSKPSDQAVVYTCIGIIVSVFTLMHLAETARVSLQLFLFRSKQANWFP